MYEAILAIWLMHPVDYMKETQWFGVTDRTLIFRSSYGLRLSSWCSGQQIISGGQWGKIHWMFRAW